MNGHFDETECSTCLHQIFLYIYTQSDEFHLIVILKQHNSRFGHQGIKCLSVINQKHPKVHVSTGLVRAVSHLKTQQARGGKTQGGVRQQRRETYTYIEISGTVKTILIGHHTERERRERRERRKRKSGGGMQKTNKQNKKRWCDAPPCGHCRKQQTRVTVEGRERGEKTVPNRL